MSLTSIAPIVSATGISVPTYAQVLAYFTTQFQGIYGADVYLGNDSQDGQWLGVIAAAVNDTNNAAVAVYNSFSPATAQGASLSSNVKLNGLTREVSTYSTADLVIVGQVGTNILNGIILDSNSNQWQLGASVVIPNSGTVTATATCTTIGAIQAQANTITTILTPQLGWQSATNPVAANPGAPVETDAQLRIRQANSTMNSSLSLMDGIVGTVANIPEVTSVVGYNNPLPYTNSLGIPANNISLVVAGGNATTIAEVIAAKKGPGCGTFGTTSITVLNVYQIPEIINFFVNQLVTVIVNITIAPIQNYTSQIGIEIQNAVSTYISNLTSGQAVRVSKLYTPANLTSPDGDTFEITSLTITGGSPDLTLQFYQQASCAPANVVLTVS